MTKREAIRFVFEGIKAVLDDGNRANDLTISLSAELWEMIHGAKAHPVMQKHPDGIHNLMWTCDKELVGGGDMRITVNPLP